MYVAVKGGERAIDNAHAWLAEARRGDASVPELSVDQIREQLALAVNRVMAEGSLYDPDLAALAIKQARGDLIEAIFLIRAYRTTLPRFGATPPIDTAQMTVRRRISATFKDLPGGQVPVLRNCFEKSPVYLVDGPFGYRHFVGARWPQCGQQVGIFSRPDDIGCNAEAAQKAP